MSRRLVGQRHLRRRRHCGGTCPAEADRLALRSVVMPANRMNRDEFYAAMAPHDDARLRKILWTVYWRGNAQPPRAYRGRVAPAGSAKGATDKPSARPSQCLGRGDDLRRTGQGWCLHGRRSPSASHRAVEMAAYVPPTGYRRAGGAGGQRPRTSAAGRCEDRRSGLRYEELGLFPLRRSLLRPPSSWCRRPWPRCGSRYCATTVSRRSPTAHRSSSSAGRRTTAGPVGATVRWRKRKPHWPFRSPGCSTTPDMWRTFAESYLEALDVAGRADPKRPRTMYGSMDETSHRRKERAERPRRVARDAPRPVRRYSRGRTAGSARRQPRTCRARPHLLAGQDRRAPR